MSAVRARAKLRDLPGNLSPQEREHEFKRMFTAFKKAVTEAGVLHSYKQHEHFESRGEKRRRKRRESEIQRLKAKLRESFPDRKRSKDKKRNHE